MRDAVVTLVLASGAGRVAGMRWVVSGPHRTTEKGRGVLSEPPCAGRSANVPGLGCRTARIHSGHKLFLVWLQLTAQ